MLLLSLCVCLYVCVCCVCVVCVCVCVCVCGGGGGGGGILLYVQFEPRKSQTVYPANSLEYKLSVIFPTISKNVERLCHA